MIIVQLTGGLGNQLFQYAMGRSLAIRNNTNLKLDVSFFETYDWHAYSLGPFNIREDFATAEECREVKSANTGWFAQLKNRVLPVYKGFVKEESLAYNPAYKNINTPSYLEGYWQSEKYFSDYEQILRSEFQVKFPPSPQNKALLDSIIQSEAISIHIRRGNFVSIEQVNKVHGTCSLDYYQRAIELLAAKCSSPRFFIFSDDVVWTKENLKISFDHVFVDINNAQTDFEDLRLMYNCKHHILANSTFSWWGAWLNNNPHKAVIGPKIWFNDARLNEDAKSIIPDAWIRI